MEKVKTLLTEQGFQELKNELQKLSLLSVSVFKSSQSDCPLVKFMLKPTPKSGFVETTVARASSKALPVAIIQALFKISPEYPSKIALLISFDQPKPSAVNINLLFANLNSNQLLF